MTPTKQAMLSLGIIMILTAYVIWNSGRSRRKREQRRAETLQSERHKFRQRLDLHAESAITALEEHVESGITGYSEVLIKDGTPENEYLDAAYRKKVWFADGHMETVTPRERVLMRAAYLQGMEHAKQVRS